MNMNKNFMVGCNYWDSASGTDMWKNWNSNVVESDLNALSKIGVKYLRVFPLWRDFQPVKKIYWYKNNLGEYVLGDDEECLDSNPFAIDSKMVNHFREFADIANKYGMKLIVSIVTGWMSGRMFVPPAIEGKNLITDPEVLMWTAKFVRGLVSQLKDISNIEMWDLGNECNCMGEVQSRYQAYTWTAFVRNAIYSSDSSRPISSGMHSLEAEENAIWAMCDQGEICDMLTTHPYPSGSIKGDIEPYNGMRTTILPTMQSEFYANISGKPCMIQEQGTFSDTLGNKEMAADFLRVNMLSAWANNITGYLWWCGMEHLNLQKAPYSWSMIERELGLLYLDKTPKPVGNEMKKIGNVIAKLPQLNKKDTDAVCVLPRGKKYEKAAGSYILAKQAGFNIEFANCETNIPESNLYIMPCCGGWQVTYRRTYDYLLDKVQNDGANLLITCTNGLFTEFEKYFGLKSYGMKNGTKTHTAHFKFGDITYANSKDYLVKAETAEVLAQNENGDVVFSRNKVGKGYVYFLGFAVEQLAFSSVDGFNPEVCEPYYKIYKAFAEKEINNYLVKCDNPFVGITQSKNDDGSYIITAINYSDKPQKFDYTVKSNYSLKILYGDDKLIQKCDAVIMTAIPFEI